ncbi:conserved hypothetical protein [Ricinus communis]|uniref:Uncharacterized protein n=1 Tax=Ricinus communis TaxID=3988 RepID=B9TE42_RICCO|nr:conserved hypothetical protein [Ricinus communis]
MPAAQATSNMTHQSQSRLPRTAGAGIHKPSTASASAPNAIDRSGAIGMVSRANAEPHEARHDGHQRAREHVRIDGRPEALEPLARITEQADDVVRDGRHRQALDGLLQPQLLGRAAVHRLQDLPVLVFLDDRHARAQQVVDVGDAARQRFLARRRRLARVHRGREAAVHEFLHGRHAFDAGFAQFLDPGLHEAVIGLRCGKAVTVVEGELFQARRELSDLCQQVLVARDGLAGHHALGEGRQFGLDVVQCRGHRARGRQAQERHHAVGVDLQHALREAAGLLRAHLDVAQHEARKTVGLDREIRPHLTALHHARAHQVVAGEAVLQGGRVGRAALQQHVRRRHQAAVQPEDPRLRQMCKRHARERLRDRQPWGDLFRERVRGELRVAFPLEAEAAEVVIEVIGRHVRRRDAEMPAQRGQQRMLVRTVLAARSGLAGAVHGEVRDGFGRFQPEEGTRMDFGGQRNALGVAQARVSGGHGR